MTQCKFGTDGRLPLRKSLKMEIGCRAEPRTCAKKGAKSHSTTRGESEKVRCVRAPQDNADHSVRWCISRMPLSLVARVPSTASALFALDEQEQTPPLSSSGPLPQIAGFSLVEHLGAGSTGSNTFAATRAPPTGGHGIVDSGNDESLGDAEASSPEVVAIKLLRDGEGSTEWAASQFDRVNTPAAQTTQHGESAPHPYPP